jgi:hypothetical protein
MILFRRTRLLRYRVRGAVQNPGLDRARKAVVLTGLYGLYILYNQPRKPNQQHNKSRHGPKSERHIVGDELFIQVCIFDSPPSFAICSVYSHHCNILVSNTISMMAKDGGESNIQTWMKSSFPTMKHAPPVRTEPTLDV